MFNYPKPRVILSPISNSDWRGVSPAAREHLENSMRSLESAKESTPAVPLYGKDDWSVVTDFYKYAQERGIVYPKWQLEYELSRESKFGRQGGRAAWEQLKPDVLMYITNVKPCRYEQIPETIEKYKTLNCRMLSVQKTLDHQVQTGKIEDRAAGWRNFNLLKSDKKAQDDAVHDASTKAIWEKAWAYIFSYIRKQKNRIFIPAPFCINILQAQYHDPFLEAIQKDLKANKINSPFTSWGDKVSFKFLFEELMAVKSKEIKGHKVLHVVRDFYHMDTTQGPEQKSKHYVPKLAAAFGFRPGSTSYFEMQDKVLFSNRMYIATPDGMIRNRVKGEGSGATVTNNGECCCNEDYTEALHREVDKRCKTKGLVAGKHYRLLDSYFNGDDGIDRYVILKMTDKELGLFMSIVQASAEYVADLFGFIVNEKWKMSLEYGIYCQYEVYIDEAGNFHADYPVSLALNAGMHPMREVSKSVWDSDYVDWRWESILRPLANRQDFTAVVDYVDNGLKYGLFGKTKQDFERILSKYDKYKALRDSSYQFNIWDEAMDKNPALSPVIIYLAKKRGFAIPN